MSEARPAAAPGSAPAQRRSAPRPRAGGAGGAVGRADRAQRRHAALGFPLGTVYKFFDDQGGYLAALLTYYGFLSIFPLLLLGSSLLGFALEGDPELQQQILDSAIAQFPVVDSALSAPQGLTGSGTAVVIGVVAALYGGLGVAQVVQHTVNVAWSVPRHRRPNPLLSRLRSLLLLVVAGSALLASSLLSTIATQLGLLADEPAVLVEVLIALLTVGLNTVVLAAILWLATVADCRWRDMLPGALAAAVALRVMQVVGTTYVDHVVRGAGPTYGVFAVVLGLLAWVYLVAVMLVLCVEVNVVRRRRLYPRALLTPFTDRVDLTDADRRAYSSYAQAQQNKGFQRVRVTFERDREP